MKNDITLRDYQVEAIDFINNNEGKLVLAMCPSSGKTETIIYYLNQLYKTNPNIKALILPHSTNVLLNNFYERLDSRNVDFTYSNNATLDVNVHVILPQNHAKINDQYDIIIIDEAHENYFAKMIQNIIVKTKVEKQILLTGTPYQFVGNNGFKMHFVALSDLDSSLIPKLRVDILESDYDWNGNYNQSKELKLNFDFKDESTTNSLKTTFDFILARNKSKKIEKTIIVCRNIKQSNSVKNYLTNIGLASEISNSENDKDSSKISDFKKNKFNILIVVNRARLGYDDIDLINLVDISGTLNPNIIYQMFARLLRGTQDMKKYYIRLSSKNDDVYNSEISTSVALMLTHTNYIKVFNGKNFNSQDIIVNSDFFVKSKKSLDKSSGKSKTLSKRKLFIDVQEDDNFDIINFFKKVIEQKEKNVGLYKFCKVSEVLNELRFNNAKSRTKEECIEDAKKYNNKRDWYKNNPTIYSYAVRHKWIKECTEHMIKLINTSRTKEECIEDAIKYKSKTEWSTKSSTFYHCAKRHKEWFKECTSHMVNLSGKSRTKEECIEDAKKYNNKRDWYKNNQSIYRYAYKKKWMNECSAHMLNLCLIRTKEECIEDAKKYNHQTDWLKNSKSIYGYARNKEWFKECTSHMINLIQSRTKGECIADAKKYNHQTDWRKNSKPIYNYARKKQWLEDCMINMTKNKRKKITKSPKSRTKEECIADALKYKYIKDWRKNSKTICAYSRSKKWFNDCTAHMDKLWSKSPRTKKECIENAKKYKTQTEWRKNSTTIYSYSRDKKWLEECLEHFEK